MTHNNLPRSHLTCRWSIVSWQQSLNRSFLRAGSTQLEGRVVEMSIHFFPKMPGSHSNYWVKWSNVKNWVGKCLILWVDSHTERSLSTGLQPPFTLDRNPHLVLKYWEWSCQCVEVLCFLCVLDELLQARSANSIGVHCSQFGKKNLLHSSIQCFSICLQLIWQLGNCLGWALHVFFTTSSIVVSPGQRNRITSANTLLTAFVFEATSFMATSSMSSGILSTCLNFMVNVG